MKASRLINRNVRVDSHRTSVRMEPEFWTALRNAAHTRKMPVDILVSQISQESPGSPLTSTIRVWLLQEGERNHAG